MSQYKHSTPHLHLHRPTTHIIRLSARWPVLAHYKKTETNRHREQINPKLWPIQQAQRKKLIWHSERKRLQSVGRLYHEHCYLCGVCVSKIVWKLVELDTNNEWFLSLGTCFRNWLLVWFEGRYAVNPKNNGMWLSQTNKLKIAQEIWRIQEKFPRPNKYNFWALPHANSTQI